MSHEHISLSQVLYVCRPLLESHCRTCLGIWCHSGSSPLSCLPFSHTCALLPCFRCLPKMPEDLSTTRKSADQPARQSASQAGLFLHFLGARTACHLASHIKSREHHRAGGWGRGMGREETTYKSGFNTHAQPTSFLSDVL